MHAVDHRVGSLAVWRDDYISSQIHADHEGKVEQIDSA